MENKTGVRPTFLVQGHAVPGRHRVVPAAGSDQKHSHTIKIAPQRRRLPERARVRARRAAAHAVQGRSAQARSDDGRPEGSSSRGTRSRARAGGARARATSARRGRWRRSARWTRFTSTPFARRGCTIKSGKRSRCSCPIKSVGVQGDQRTHSHVVGLRAITSSDGMTADWFQFEPKFLQEVSAKICNQVRNVNRVVYDITASRRPRWSGSEEEREERRRERGGTGFLDLRGGIF